jgi:hypothetical protein
LDANKDTADRMATNTASAYAKQGEGVKTATNSVAADFGQAVTAGSPWLSRPVHKNGSLSPDALARLYDQEAGQRYAGPAGFSQEQDDKLSGSLSDYERQAKQSQNFFGRQQLGGAAMSGSSFTGFDAALSDSAGLEPKLTNLRTQYAGLGDYIKQAQANAKSQADAARGQGDAYADAAAKSASGIRKAIDSGIRAERDAQAAGPAATVKKERIGPRRVDAQDKDRLNDWKYRERPG